MKNVYKWTAVAVISLVLIISVASIRPSSPVYTPQAPETEEVFSDDSSSRPKTEFPKLALSSPFGEEGYLQSLVGSGRDEVKELWHYDGEVFAIGESTSFDYDFSESSGIVFLAKINSLGTLLSIVKIDSSITYLDSALTSEGIIILSLEEGSSRLSLFDFNLNQVKSISLNPLSEGFLLLCDDSLRLLSASTSLTITEYGFDLTEKKKIALNGEGNFTLVDFSKIGDTLISLCEKEGSTFLFKADNKLSSFESKKLDKLTPLSALPALFSDEVGYSLLYKDGEGKVFSGGITLSGKWQWSTCLSTAEDARLLRTKSGRYIAFLREDDKSTATLLCSHGDILEQSVISLSGSFPVEYTYEGGGLLVLTKSCDNQKGALVFLGENDAPQYVFSLPALPSSFVLLEDGKISVGLNISVYESPFGSGKGELSSFVLSVSP